MDDRLLEFTDELKTSIFMSGYASKKHLLLKDFKCRFYWVDKTQPASHLLFNTEKDKTWFLMKLPRPNPSQFLIHYFQELSASCYDYHE